MSPRAFIIFAPQLSGNAVSRLVIADGIALYPRPNVVPEVLHGSQYPGGKAFNSAAFTALPTGHQGNFGRNVLRGFGAGQADAAFQRQIFGHSTKTLAGGLGSGGANGGFNPLYQIGGPSSIQPSLKLQF